MLFFVQAKRGRQATVKTFPHVVLVRDDWDDYGYRTKFMATLVLGHGSRVSLGDLRILHEGQTGGSTPISIDPFKTLGPGYCSLGRDLGYYIALHKLGPAVSREYLEAMSDVVYNDEAKARFEDTEGYRVSLLRPPRREEHYRGRRQAVPRCGSTPRER